LIIFLTEELNKDRSYGASRREEKKHYIGGYVGINVLHSADKNVIGHEMNKK
jgi:hypothetical protein